MTFSTTINKMFGNSILLSLPMNLRVRIREIDECSRVGYNGTLCIFKYNDNNEYVFIQSINLFEAYFTIQPITEYIDTYYTEFGGKIKMNVDSKTFKRRPSDTNEKVEMTLSLKD